MLPACEMDETDVSDSKIGLRFDPLPVLEQMWKVGRFPAIPPGIIHLLDVLLGSYERVFLGSKQWSHQSLVMSKQKLVRREYGLVLPEPPERTIINGRSNLHDDAEKVNNTELISWETSQRVNCLTMASAPPNIQGEQST